MRPPGAQCAETTIPEFAPYTSARHLQRLLQRHGAELFDEPVAITDCTIVQSFFRPYEKPSSRGKSTLSICVRLGLGDPGRSVVLYCKLFLEGRSKAAWQRLEKSPGQVGNAAATWIGALDMIVWRFPHDPRIRHLPQAVVVSNARQHLPCHRLPTPLGSDPVELTIEPVKYLPEKCCTSIYRLRSGAQSATLYGKTYSDDRGRSIYRRIERFHRTGLFKLPEPLAYSEPIQTLWTRAIDGRPLAEVIDRSNCGGHGRKAGAALAALHDMDPGDLDNVSVQQLLADFTKKIRKLGRAFPACEPELAALNAAVQRGAAVAGTAPRRTLHGDFHIDQMLVSGDDVYLLDFDSVVVGEPEQDLAEFVVALWFREFDPALARGLSMGLIDAYRAAARRDVCFDRLRWYAWVEYLVRAYRFYREQKPGWGRSLQQALLRLPALDAVIGDLNDAGRAG